MLLWSASRASSCWCCPGSAARSAPSSCARPAARRRSSSSSRPCEPSARCGSAATAASSRSRGRPSGSGSAAPDEVETSPDGTLVFRGLLPHLTWGGGRRLSVGHDFWSVAPEPPVLDRGRLVYSYRLEPLGEPRRPESRRSAPRPPTRTPRRFSRRCGASGTRSTRASRGSPCMLPADVQARAFDHRGGPLAARRATVATAVAAGVLGAYVLSFLPGPPADPLAPFLGGLAVGLVVDAVRADPRDAPGPLRAEPLPLPAALGLAPPRAPGLARPPRRRAGGARSNWSDLRPARFGFLKRLQAVGFSSEAGADLVHERQ